MQQCVMAIALFMDMRPENDMKTLLQTLCIVLVSIGIGYEIYSDAPLGYVLIALGSLAFAVSTKIEREKG